ncbi:ATP-binding cassette domain-containing protein [Geminocystis sp. NIES-3709]|uniref:ATP-binding cassette domain-containing protein n=1 Tax=Geminocystis sp. NIES-3709 TaxID=1617448 RepID=UPI0005FCCADE|nr:ATP-binding cassette domain-containing protein [Geminocystis sp. NIES-3709]BAQ66302.1 ABC transporter [Geminocystis sp. NIES-3709]
MNNFPSNATVLATNPYIIINNQGEISPCFELTKSQHILGRDPNFADLLVPSDWSVISRCQATIIKVNNDYIIYDGDRNNPSSNKLFINNSLITPNQGYRLNNGDTIRIGQNINVLVMIQFFDPNKSFAIENTGQKSISLKQKSTVLGRDETANLRLIAPTVSRKHAVIDYQSDGKYILHDYSSNGVFVDDIKVDGKINLTSGSIIKIAPYTLVIQGDELLIADNGDNIRLDAENILRVVKDKKGKPITLLNNISLPIEPGQLVALVGGSGAGKSTFMRTLLGIEPTTSGTVYLNGENLRNNFNIYRNQIGYVPQSDIVHRDLRVEEVLRYTAKLRLPNDADIDSIIEKTLVDIEMVERRDVFVKNLSGGQLKRVSIGVELLVDPKLFFLDEPTSGLDPGLDKKMMQLLRKLADQGRTVILVTHATTNINLCDRLVFLGQGGNLCYFGNYQDATKFFDLKTGDFADIYIQLDSKEAVLDTANKFKRSEFYDKYITQKLGTDYQSKATIKPKKVKGNFIQQVLILSQRYYQLIMRDKVNLIISLLTAPIGIFLIDLAIRKQEPFILGEKADPALAPLTQTVIFVFTSAAIWVGLATSLQEIVKEIDIYLRERLVNLNLFAYLKSKIGVLSGLAFLQTVLMVAVILFAFSPPESETISWLAGISITTFLTLFASMSLGLMISATVKNSTQANSALPLLLLPQIIFSGVLFQIEGVAKYLSWSMISRWSVGAYGSLVNINSLVPEVKVLPDGTEIEPPFKITDVYDPDWGNLSLNWKILVLHSLIYLTITWIMQKRKDIL